MCVSVFSFIQLAAVFSVIITLNVSQVSVTLFPLSAGAFDVFFPSVEQFAALFLFSLVLFLMFKYALSLWVVSF